MVLLVRVSVLTRAQQNLNSVPEFLFLFLLCDMKLFQDS